jgi:redox-sensitive bicupin YhaK (pirin superfamily)
MLKTALCVGLGTFALAAGTPAHAQWPHPGWRRAVVVYGGQLEASPRQARRCVIKHRVVVAGGRTLVRRGRC